MMDTTYVGAGGLVIALLLVLVLRRMGGRRKEATEPALYFHKNGAVAFVDPVYRSGALYLPTGGYAVIENAATLNVAGQVFFPVGERSPDGQRRFWRTHDLREGDGTEMDLRRGPELGYIGRPTGTAEVKALTTGGLMAMARDGIKEGSPAEQLQKVLVKLAVASVALGLLSWVAVLGLQFWIGRGNL